MAEPTLVIPADLLPADGRFGCGPSRVRPEQIAALSGPAGAVIGTSHRAAPVRDLVARVQERLAALLELPEGHEVVLGVGGASAFWDAAVLGLVSQRSQHAVHGEFGAKFAAAAARAPFLAEPTVLRAEPGGAARPVAQEDVDLYAWAHNETSTGVTVPVERPAGAGGDQLVVVDGTSAAGGIAFDAAAVDAYFFSPQKNLGSDGGLWLAVLSPAARERIERIAASGRWIPAFLSLASAVADSRRHQTLNTPAVVTLVLLDEQLGWLLDNGGMAWVGERTAASAAHLYSWAEAREWATPFVADPALRSPVVGTVDLDPQVPVEQVAGVLRANGIVDVEGYRALRRNQMRVGMFPSTDPADVQALTACVDWVVERLG